MKKNAFKEGAPYKGINTTYLTPEGHPFELQFHTSQSFYVKQNLTHGIYEQLRVLPEGDPAGGTGRSFAHYVVQDCGQVMPVSGWIEQR